MVRQQQAGVGHVVDHGGGGVDGHRHRLHHVGGIPADQADGVPGLGQRRRVGGVEHLDNLAQPHAHSAQQ